MFKGKSPGIILGIFFILIAIPRIIFFDLDHGDEFSDACAMTAEDNFLKFGLAKCHFFFSFEYNTDSPKDFYTHAPPLTAVLNGFLGMIPGADSLLFFRVVSIFLSFLTILCWYLFIKKFSGSSLVACWAALFYLINPFFIYKIDAVSGYCYSELVRMLMFFLVFIFVNAEGGKRKIFLLTLWVVSLIISLICFDGIIYLFLYVLLFKYFFTDFKNKISIKNIFVIMSASAVGLSMYFLQNVWHFGGFSLAFQDLKSIFLKRTVGGYEIHQGLNFLDWFKYVILRNFSLVFYFDALVVLLSIFFVIFLYLKLSDETKIKVKKLFRLFIIFLICGISWYVFFPSHSLAHAFVNFLVPYLVPAAGIGFTIFVYIIYSYLKESDLWNNIYLKALWVVVVGIIIFTGIIKSELPITFSKIERAQDFKVFKQCLLKLKAISGEKDNIGVNYYRYPFIRYYAHRHCDAVFNKTFLENQSLLPRYFIFIPHDNQESRELFGFLQYRYITLWQCSSRRFPAVFLKLKDS